MKILMSCFACDPNQGSEPGIGWHWAEQASRFHDVWVITHRSHKNAVEEHRARYPNARLNVEYVDFPPWMQAWGHQGVAFKLRYVAWQFMAHKAASRLNEVERFDLAQHVTYGSYRFPTFLSWMTIPFIWGPIGGGERAPIAFYRTYGIRGLLHELVRDANNVLSRIDPIFLLASKRAKSIIAVTPETAAMFPRFVGSKVIVQPAIGMDVCDYSDKSAPPPVDDTIRLVYAGQLLHRKGVHLLIESMSKVNARTKNIELSIIGSGPMDSNLRLLIEKLQLKDTVRILGRLDRKELLEVYRDHDIFVFPSLQDSGGFVILEAMVAKLPVICLDLGGPAQMVTNETGVRIPAKRPTQVVAELADAIIRIAQDRDLRTSLGEAGRKRVQDSYRWDVQGDFLNGLYNTLIDRANRGDETSPSHSQRRPTTLSDIETSESR